MAHRFHRLHRLISHEFQEILFVLIREIRG